MTLRDWDFYSLIGKEIGLPKSIQKDVSPQNSLLKEQRKFIEGKTFPKKNSLLEREREESLSHTTTYFRQEQ